MLDHKIRENIVRVARTWIGTPYYHQARVKGVGADCAGLIIGVGRECGLLDLNMNYDGYARSPEHGYLEPICNKELFRTTKDYPEAGDILLLTWGNMQHPQHLAIFTGEGSIVHSYAVVKKCVEHPFHQKFMGKTRGIYEYKVKDNG